MLDFVLDWYEKHPAVLLSSLSAMVAVIALSFTARSFRLNARVTKVTLFNNVRQRIEDAGKRVEGASEDPKEPTPDHYAYLNELDWLCHLVRQKDIPLSMFGPYYGETFELAVDDYRSVIDKQRGEQVHAYDDILWVERKLRRLKLKWYQRVPLLSRFWTDSPLEKKTPNAVIDSTPAPPPSGEENSPPSP